jgi:cellulose synthase (UDP-forming)
MRSSVPSIEITDAFSENMQIHLKDRIVLFRCLVVINLLFGAWYLAWRINHSVNYQALWISIPLLVAEIYAYLGGALFFVGLWKPIVRQVRSLKFMTPPILEQDLPSVDIFITCYNEPIDCVEKTARAALAIDYPATKLQVYILDDGNSPAMRKMAEELCLEDLHTPALIQAGDRLNAERLRLQSAIQELEALKLEIFEVDQALQVFHLQTKTHYDELSQVIAWFNSLKPKFVPDAVWLEIQTALGEGFDNAVCHAHKHLPENTPIDIHLFIYPHTIQIEVLDCGIEFEFESRLLQLPDQVCEYAERGRGLLILQKIVDHMSYTRTSHQRNRLLLIKSYSPIQSGLSYKASDYLTSQLQIYHRLLLLGNADYDKPSDYLKSQLKTLYQQLHRKELELADLARCRYIARPKPAGKPHHAKAGNINYAIFSGETSGDLILTLDADHVPKSHFLQRVIPHFFTFDINTYRYQSNQIAFVQTPQAFYNLPPNDLFGHQAHLFYGVIQQAKDGMNSAFYTGTNAVLRREALISVGLQNFADEFLKNESRLDEFELIGGVSSASITEDMNTAMRLHAAGWKSAYHHEVLAEGLAPDDLSSTLKQKLRWAQGTIQVLSNENPLTKPGLSLEQRLQYFQTMYSYFSGFFVVIFVACPILFFYTDIVPVSAYGETFAIHFLPAFLLNRLTMVVASWGVPIKELWRSEQYAIALFPLYIRAVWSVFTARPIKFQVTPKQRQAGKYFNLIKPQIAVVVLTLVGIVWSIYRFLIGELNNPWIYALNTAWALYNIALISVVIQAAIWQPTSQNSKQRRQIK